MVELVDTYALGAYALRCAGSNPVPGTIYRARARFLCDIIVEKEAYGVCEIKICQQ